MKTSSFILTAKKLKQLMIAGFNQQQSGQEFLYYPHTTFLPFDYPVATFIESREVFNISYSKIKKGTILKEVQSGRKWTVKAVGDLMTLERDGKVKIWKSDEIKSGFVIVKG